jgi:hypothetical protein
MTRADRPSTLAGLTHSARVTPAANPPYIVRFSISQMTATGTQWKFIQHEPMTASAK